MSLTQRDAAMFLCHLGDATLHCSSESAEAVREIQRMCGVHGDCERNRELLNELLEGRYES